MLCFEVRCLGAAAKIANRVFMCCGVPQDGCPACRRSIARSSSNQHRDVFGIEPVPSDWPLLKLPNVTLTPHIAGASVKTITHAANTAAEEVRRYLAGEPPVHRC